MPHGRCQKMNYRTYLEVPCLKSFYHGFFLFYNNFYSTFLFLSLTLCVSVFLSLSSQIYYSPQLCVLMVFWVWEQVCLWIFFVYFLYNFLGSFYSICFVLFWYIGFFILFYFCFLEACLLSNKRHKWGGYELKGMWGGTARKLIIRV